MMEEWRRGRLDDMMDFIAPHANHVVHIDGEAVPQLAGVSGRDAMRERFTYLVDSFVFEKFEIDALSQTENTVRAVISYRYRHRATGERIESVMRLVLDWEEAGFVDISEFVDAPAVQAFLRVTGEIS
ncbi:MAG: nuclear transport factor 2 family protein [Pseudomonadota bacterium]